MSRENVEVVRQLFDEFAKGNFRGLGQYFHPDIEFQRFWGAGYEADSWHGLQGFRAGIVEYIEAFHDLRTEGEKFIDLGDDRVLVYARHRGTAKSSGIPYEKEITDVITVRAGLVVKWQSYWERQEALEAVGLRE